MEKKPAFHLDLPFRDRWRQTLFSVVRPSLERVFSLDRLSQKYLEICAGGGDGDFTEKVLRGLNISYDAPSEDFDRVPRSGPVVVVANHPFGGIEGVILANFLKRVRPDVKIMANFLLARVPELRDLFFFVDPFGSQVSVRKNITPIRDSVQWVKQGGLLTVFPAGTVSHLHLSEREIKDPPWSNTVARVIRSAKAPVLPIFFHGANGPLFQFLGLVHPTLRTAMLPTELLNKTDSTIELDVGSLIPYEKLASFDDDTDMLSYLRLRTYILSSNRKPATSPRRKIFSVFKKKVFEPVVPAQNTAALFEEVSKLPKEQLLVESGEFAVYYARAWQMPMTLREIGRLREITFRKANEGTGKSIDLDRFDDYYYHLFAWNKKRNEVVGGYRLGKTDVIVEQYGREGLYTQTLFNYRLELLDQIGPAFELGRSFVRPEYQRSYSALLVLWKGIARLVTLNPRYKMLFGPVSINNDYDSVSRELIVSFLREHGFIPELARLVKPRNPIRTRSVVGADPKTSSVVVRDIDEVSELVSEIESDRRGVPVLLRQYMKIGGKLLGFNVDPNFGDVLDGLILVDLTQAQVRWLEKYCGKEEAHAFLAYHRTHQTKGKYVAHGPVSSPLTEDSVGTQNGKAQSSVKSKGGTGPRLRSVAASDPLKRTATERDE